VPSIVLQQGWSPQVHAGFHNLPFDVMVVWGEGFADALRPVNPGVRFEVAGNHALAADAPSQGDAVGVFLQSTSHLIAPEHLEQLVGLAAQLADELPRVFVREHPSSPVPEELRAKLGRVVFADAADVGLTQLLARCRTTLSIYSTTLYESVAAGAVPVSFNPTSLPSLEPSIAAWSVGFEVSEPDAARDAVLHGHIDDSARQSFLARFLPYVGADAVGRVEAVISRAAQ
jgi:hypothetical protein